MSSKIIQEGKLFLEATVPLMPGTISIAYAKCGKPNCVCKAKKPKLHGPYYRWTGAIDGKKTTKTLTKGQAEECERRIKNYRELQTEVDKLLKKSLKNAPWKE
jgi:hypothetical protein